VKTLSLVDFNRLEEPDERSHELGRADEVVMTRPGPLYNLPYRTPDRYLESH
jgi:hypothetical protein